MSVLMTISLFLLGLSLALLIAAFVDWWDGRNR